MQIKHRLACYCKPATTPYGLKINKSQRTFNLTVGGPKGSGKIPLKGSLDNPEAFPSLWQMKVPQGTLGFFQEPIPHL